jgi:hypothetical protein
VKEGEEKRRGREGEGERKWEREERGERENTRHGGPNTGHSKQS